MTDEMQILAGTRARYIKQPADLMLATTRRKGPQGIVERVLVLIMGLERREQQVRAAWALGLLHEQQRTSVAARPTPEPRTDDDIVFQALGLMDGQDMQARGLWIGGCVEFLQVRAQLPEVYLARHFAFRQGLEKH